MSEFQHPVQCAHSDLDLGRLTLIGARLKTVTDDPFEAADVGRNQRSPVVASHLLPSYAIGATAFAASVTDPGQFRSGRQFTVWLGLTPLQNSSGGKERLGRISKIGDKYLRRLLVIGATALVRYSCDFLQVGQISPVALRFHVVTVDEAKRCRVDAIAQTAAVPRTIVEHMP